MLTIQTELYKSNQKWQKIKLLISRFYFIKLHFSYVTDFTVYFEAAAALAEI